MRVTPLALVLSFLISIGAIVLLTALPGPGVDRGIVDRHTGRVLDAPSEVLSLAVSTGNAAAARDVLASLSDARRDDPMIARALFLLEAELAPAPPPPTESHPWRESAPRAPSRLLEALTAFAGGDAGPEFEALFAVTDATPVAGVQPLDHAAAALLGQLDAGAPVAPADFTNMAMAFDRSGRARARDRWLRRAMTRFPTDIKVRLAMARVFVREGRLYDAAAVTNHIVPPPGLAQEWWGLRADLGLWLGRYADEATALTELLGMQFDETRARRLIRVQRAAALLDEAARTALALGAHTGRVDDLVAAADAAFDAGLADEGRKVLASLAESAADPTPWQRRLAAVELQDLRFDHARQHLEAVFERTRDPLDERELERLYRRRRLLEPLADLLSQRWSAAPPPSGSPTEVLHLLVAAGRREQAKDLLRQLATAELQPVQFGRLLPWFVDEGVVDLTIRAEVLAAAVAAEDVKEFVDALAGDPRFAPALEILAARFPTVDAVFAARVQLCWAIPDARRGLAAARALSAERPSHLGALQVLAAHAAGAKDAEAELRAAERIFRLAPGDRDNAVRRAWALSAIGRHDDAAVAWQSLLADGYEPARAPLFDSLLGAGRIDEVARRIADWRRLDPASLLTLGDGLWAVDRADLARAAYGAVLEVDPEHPTALLRSGLLLAESDPAGALPFLVRRLELSEADRPTVSFHVGEALWSLGHRGEALPFYRYALAGLTDGALIDADTGAMVARALHRVGRVPSAVMVYEELLAKHPTNQSLQLDLAELLGDIGATDRAAAAIDAARALGADSRRFLRVEAQHLLRVGDPRGARRSLLRSLARHRPDDGEVVDLSTAYEHLGEFGAALANYQRWSALRRSRESRGGEQRMRDRLATQFGVQGHYREIGDDTSWESAIYGATTLSERTRIQGRAGWGDYRGRSQAVAAGTVDVVTETPLIDLGVVHRHGPGRDQIGGGIRLHPDAVGDRDFGAWVEGYWEHPVPTWSLSLRAGFDELWTEPAAAAGLGGRRTGVALAAYRELGNRGWLSAEAAYERVRVRAPAQARVEDDRATADLQLGWRWTDAEIAMADPFRVDRAPAGPVSPWLGDGPLEHGDLHLVTWMGFTADHVLGDAAVTTVLPISETVHFLYAAARADCRLVSGLGVTIDGLAGTDLRGGGSAWEVAGGLTWRPHYGMEWSGRAGVGDAFGRGNFDGSAVFARVDGVLRF